ncbi:MAG: hypothetical protein JXR94_01565 [Candidatus Hydrogenedentes bacterium]|nr:hypothetical protein [Candidatus Hydrogenedentota bacterium]
MNLPLAELELTRAGRRGSTYALRGIVVGLTWLGLLWVWSVFVLFGRDDQLLLAMVGPFTAGVAQALEFFAVFAVGPLFSAGLIAQEKRDRTLGLLLTADIRGLDIFLAKFLTAFLYVELLAFSALPVLAIASLLGGISVPGMAMQLLILSFAALAVCAVGLLCSTLSEHPIEALFRLVVFEGLWFLVTLVIDWGSWPFPRCRTNILAAALAVERSTADVFYWLPSVAIALAIAAVASFLTVRLLPRQAHEKAPVRRRSPTRTGVLSKPRFAMKPAARLVAASAPGLAVHSWPWPLQWLVALALIPLAVFPCVGTLFVMLLVVYDVTSSLTAARDEGSFACLLVTPAGDRELARAIYAVFTRRALLFFPAVALGGGLNILHEGIMGLAASGVPSSPWLARYLCVSFLLSPLASLLAYVSAGCWASTLRMRPVAQALVGVFTLIFVSFVACMLPVSCLGVFLVDTMLESPDPLSVVGVGATPIAMLIVCAVAYAFYRRFAWHLSRKWRTGRHVAA